jgi:hypothetical protein
MRGLVLVATICKKAQNRFVISRIEGKTPEKSNQEPGYSG